MNWTTLKQIGRNCQARPLAIMAVFALTPLSQAHADDADEGGFRQSSTRLTADNLTRLEASGHIIGTGLVYMTEQEDAEALISGAAIQGPLAFYVDQESGAEASCFLGGCLIKYQSVHPPYDWAHVVIGEDQHLEFRTRTGDGTIGQFHFEPPARAEFAMAVWCVPIVAPGLGNIDYATVEADSARSAKGHSIVEDKIRKWQRIGRSCKAGRPYEGACSSAAIGEPNGTIVTRNVTMFAAQIWCVPIESEALGIIDRLSVQANSAGAAKRHPAVVYRISQFQAMGRPCSAGRPNPGWCEGDMPNIPCEGGDHPRTQISNKAIAAGVSDQYCHTDQDTGYVYVKCISGSVQIRNFGKVYSGHPWTEDRGATLSGGQDVRIDLKELSWYADQKFRVHIIGKRASNSVYTMDFKTDDN